MALGKIIGLDSSTSWDPQVSIIPSFIHNFGVDDSVTVYVDSNVSDDVAITAALSATTYYNVTKVNNREFKLTRVANTILPTNQDTTATLTISVAADATKGYNAVTRTVKIGYGTGGTGAIGTFGALSATAPNEIQKALNAGIAENIWNVGDSTGTITIGSNQVVGCKSTWDSGGYAAYILGFNHNAALETGGRKSIHFCLGRGGAGATSSGIRGKDIAFVDSKLYLTGNDAAFRMNLVNSNSGGWAQSYMRTVICSQFREAMFNSGGGTPNVTTGANMASAFAAYMKPVIKYTDNVGGATNNYENVTGTEDYIFLMSEFEIFGTRSYANSYEKSFQQRYDYYAINNTASARIRVADVSVGVRGDNPAQTLEAVNAGAAVHWWERSPSGYGIDRGKSVYTCVGHMHDANYVFNFLDSYEFPSPGRGDHSLGFVPNFVMVAA